MVWNVLFAPAFPLMKLPTAAAPPPPMVMLYEVVTDNVSADSKEPPPPVESTVQRAPPAPPPPEITRQVGSASQFLKLNRIQAESLAGAFGMSRDQMAEMLKQQELLSKLGAKQLQPSCCRHR